jgi:non-specific serine/threonine protein kinase/serine/threonine-protein kinase
LRRRISGDLDNIVLKAIRKEPGARYSSADQLSEDIRRHLEGLPVLARKSTVVYRCRKYALRHKVGVAAAALVFLSLLTGIALTLHEARVARANELRAERRFNDVRKLANSLIFEVYDSIWQLPGATAARQLTIQRAQEYLDSLAQESASDPSLLRELAAAYSRLASVQGNGRDVNFGDSQKALGNWRKAAALLESAASLQSSNRDIQRELARAYLNLALGLRQVGERAENETYLKKTMQILEPLAAANPGDLEIQYALAKAYEQSANSARYQNDLVRALEFYQKANAIYERLGAAQPENQQFQREISFSHKHLGGTLRQQNLLAEALEHERAALAIDEAQLARNPESVQDRYNITFTYNDTGLILGKQGDLDGALAYYHKALEIRTALAAADPRDDRTREGLSNTLNYIGDDLLQKKDYRGALDSYKKALAIRQALSQKDPANERLRFERSMTESNIGVVYAQMALRKTGGPADELKYCREAKEWIGASWPTWMERKTQGKLEDDAGAFAQVAQNLEECSRVIARLDRTVKSPVH